MANKAFYSTLIGLILLMVADSFQKKFFDHCGGLAICLASGLAAV